jgi:hypothetical protein
MFKVLMCVQNFYHSTCDHEILCADRSSEDEQLLRRPLLQKPQNMNMVGSLNLKFTFCFTDTTHEKRSLVQ